MPKTLRPLFVTAAVVEYKRSLSARTQYAKKCKVGMVHRQDYIFLSHLPTDLHPILDDGHQESHVARRMHNDATSDAAVTDTSAPNQPIGEST